MKSSRTASSAMAARTSMGSCWRSLGQTVSAVDLGPFLQEPLPDHAFHQAVDHSVSRLLTGTHLSVKSIHLNADERRGAPLSLGCDHFCNPAACPRRDGLALGPPPPGA